MRNLVDLIGHLAWPVTVLVVFVMLRRQVRQAADAIGERIADRSSDLEITREGLRIRSRLDALAGAVESQALAQDLIAQTAIQAGGRRGTPAGEPPAAPAPDGERGAPIPGELTRLADEYLAVSVPDWAERVRRKDALANTMGGYVVTHAVSKDALAGQRNQGLLVALASAVNAFPEYGDAARLLRAAPALTRLHVKYRFTVAFGGLIQKRLVTPAEVEAVERTLDAFEEGADGSLRARINATRSIARQAPLSG
jgi:hypothetical protein